MDPDGMYGARAEYYDAIYHWKNYQAEAERLHALLGAEGIPDGARVLEAGCGTGSHLQHLHQWYDVAGFDLNEGMLGIARKKLSNVSLFRADMVDFVTPEPVDALLSLFSSIGYVHPENRLRSAVQAFARAVRPGGVVVVEPWLTEADFKVGSTSMETAESKDLKLCRACISGKEGSLSILNFHWLVVRAGAQDVEHFVDRHVVWMCPRELLIATFDNAGFDVRWEPNGFSKSRGLIVGRRRSC